ncbi:LAMI_0H03466g1_1 [Lachancea mirantina]|uniref:Small ribosomal subunit protein mS41 n=1 Tax=Lachancea mirantina TaxID=1230905 RepID=A0A1G4KE99_9SACH|nr:LAMI_0H03466g1_1 [Lachancea mirantina]
MHSFMFKRSFSSSLAFLQTSKTSFVNRVPPVSSAIPDVNTFLKTIGRKCDEFSELYENQWESLFKWDSATLKRKGIPTQQRKYILSQVEKFRKQEPIKETKIGKKSYWGGERKRNEVTARLKAQERNVS